MTFEMTQAAEPDRPPKIIIVDDSLTNLKFVKTAMSPIAEVYAVTSAKKMFDLMEKVKPTLILLDITMPEINGLDAIKILKSSPFYSDIPVIFLTSVNSKGAELEGLCLGAVDYITKPFEPLLLLKRVETHLTLQAQKRAMERQSLELQNFNVNLVKMVAEEAEKVSKMQFSVLETVVDLVESRDDITGGHISRTMKWLGFLLDGLEESGIYAELTRDWNKKMILHSSRLHDVGKISISDAILKKPSKLTGEEFEDMKRHTTIGASIIDRIRDTLPSDNHEFMNQARILAVTHHEKWDGSGYPHGLVGSNIPLQGRVMAIADVYDALISKRPYKNPLPHEMAESIIIEGAGSHFDPYIVEVFKLVSWKFAQNRAC
ncbi:MAG: response regulator [Deltaproteobacteria bacterium]|jgi:putative two-component system response regulator|nr:response regulator [Deltaproteobacteria bacterium]